MTTHKDLKTLFIRNTGSTLYIPKNQDDPKKLTAYFRDRTDQSTVSDIRRWR